MTGRNASRILASGAVAMLASAPSQGGATIYTSYSAWSAAIGGTDAKIDFNIGTPGFVAEQYAWMGVHFEPGQLTAVQSGVVEDGWIAGTTFDGGHKMTLDFDAPQFALAGDFLTTFKVTLSLGDIVVYESLLVPVSPVFRGLVSTSAFDHAVFERVPGPLIGIVDNLYVGTPIPAPAVGTMLLAGLLAGGHRRRRGG